MTGRPDASVFVEAPARLHFGVLDLHGGLGRRFGGMGAAIPTPSLLVEAARASDVEADGPDAERAVGFARRMLALHGQSGGARLRVHRAIPAHVGLGSGTQLGLAVARAVAELYQLPAATRELARAVDRGQRSAIGTWAFESGGFILEGGRRPGTDEVAPLLARYEIPPTWRYVVVIPAAAPGLSGDAEADAFRRLPPPDTREVERVAHLVLMRLLPGLVERDLEAFGSALSEIQRITGGWFAGAQGSVFAPGPTGPLIERLAAAGAAGVGQSSWGPTAYAIVEGAERGRELARLASGWLGNRGSVFEGAFLNRGARVWRGSTNALAD
ncbi:MAG: beta-ribofuranosylaminobenzene 5'-phosphate synthase family protein [Deltaproteobacteria bacterium]